ncbi:Na+/H+ antiporter NhaC [Sediminibacillus dalangtanensis]|uniref:Na+/H+ antiporter NhaC n=1 Tax=Sediminibacillus dalangtanensis TaxID=2729421 RepID=A0ABX7VNX3_9BACI|nr:Na+/H+ antiporter NhaC [Sediminibacillus dalangtanensis]QTM98584.1 Na+/H+ antiporter NhaC [Sediminibacillus dalangtanensis]
MFQINPKQTPPWQEAAMLLVLVIVIIGLFIIKLETVPHIPLILAVLTVTIYGLLKRIPFADLQSGMAEGARTGIGAVFLFLLIGILISSWMVSGTIPVLMNTGIQLIGGTWFFAIVFAVTALIGTALGSSLTTSATIGVAFIGMAEAMDLSLAVSAGAVVSGAFFGDKMSPLSDTTNLASTIVEVDLFQHIKNMAWTTLPAFLITFIIFVILSPNRQIGGTQLDQYQQGLSGSGLLHWYAWLPLVLLIVLTLFKIPAFLTIAASSLLATLTAGLSGSMGWLAIWKTWYSGYMANTGIETVDGLLSRGGMESMFLTISLVLLALGLGGLLFVTGIIPSLLKSIQSKLTSLRRLTTTTVLTAIGANLLIGEQYLSILLTGEAYKKIYDEQGIARKKLARTLEDAGTVINPLVPWSVCGVFLADVLGVPVLTYLPFAFFCMLCPVLTLMIKGDR